MKVAHLDMTLGADDEVSSARRALAPFNSRMESTLGTNRAKRLWRIELGGMLEMESLSSWAARERAAHNHSVRPSFRDSLPRTCP